MKCTLALHLIRITSVGKSTSCTTLIDLTCSQITDGEDKSEFQLSFTPEGLFLLGSPVALFVTIRNQGRGLSKEFKLPTCPRLYNIFHPLDPVAYRMEPLLDPSFKSFPPMVIPHFKGMKLIYQVQQISDTISQGFKALNNIFQWSSSTRTSSNTNTGSGASAGSTSGSLAGDKSAAARQGDDIGSLRGVLLNREGRIDYALQEGAFESTAGYLSALSCHIGYFEDKDIARYAS